MMQAYQCFFSVFIAGLVISGCQSPAPLNSERIADKYGSYGVEILHASNSRRVTNLYSGTGNNKTMRTLAVVEFESTDDPRIAAEHAAIVAGGSIGATFKENGWRIQKDTVEFCEQIFDSDSLPPLVHMHIQLPQLLAVYVYRFSVSKNGDSIDYASITEVYHPNYLGFDQLIANNEPMLEPRENFCSTPVSELQAPGDPPLTLKISREGRSRA